MMGRTVQVIVLDGENVYLRREAEFPAEGIYMLYPRLHRLRVPVLAASVVSSIGTFYAVPFILLRWTFLAPYLPALLLVAPAVVGAGFYFWVRHKERPVGLALKESDRLLPVDAKDDRYEAASAIYYTPEALATIASATVWRVIYSQMRLERLLRINMTLLILLLLGLGALLYLVVTSRGS